MWVVIQGGKNCGYCGNQINLCQRCYYRMRRECYDIPCPQMAEVKE